MDRKAIRTDDQRLERNRLIEYNRQKRAEKITDDEKSLTDSNKQLMVLYFKHKSFKGVRLISFYLDSTK